MSKTPNYDTKVKEILDNTHEGEHTCGITGEKWLMDDEEIGWYKKFNVPPSKFSPLSRMRLLTNTFSAGQWWYNKHAETGRPIITWVHPATGMRVLPDKEWFSKDFIDTNVGYDLSQAFFNQLWELRLKVPKFASGDYAPSENSISCFSYGDINSYFVGACKSKNSFFSIVALNTEDSSEVYNSNNVTSSYRVIHCERVYNCQYISESKDCLNSAFVFDCRNCEYCFGATNKRNKKFVWFNEQLSEEEWNKRRTEVDLGSREVTQKNIKKFNELMAATVWPENFNVQSENSIGEYLTKSTDNKYVYFSDGGARNNYWNIWAIGKSENNAFCADPTDGQENYYTAGATNSFRCLFSLVATKCQNCEYCIDTYECENCFGCVGLRYKKFCILNAQYNEEDYWKLVDEIKCRLLESNEYGDSLPAKFSGGYFPESGGVKYHLADLEFGKKINANLFDPNSEDAIGEELTKAREITDISEIPDHCKSLGGWDKKVLFDSKLKRRFAFLALEIEWYQKHSIAPPVEHQIERVRKLIMSSNSGVFENKKCSKCEKDMIVSKNLAYPDRVIYCNACYLKYIEEHS
ncbi:MAG: hypothetical protein V1664_05520 [Candidatus Uhrbacteria bacterium]